MLYNIRYGTGGKRIYFPLSGYLKKTHRNLEGIIQFMRGLNPDLIGLIEVDAGSYRSSKKNQAEMIAESLGHYHIYKSKYGETDWLSNHMPILNRQGNAFIARDSITNGKYHYFEKGMKKLIIELELENVTVFLVHLALSFRVRHYQLSALHSILKEAKRPVIVAGDFNAFWGEREIDLFLAASGLQNANPGGQPSFPSWAPKRHLDFILHSEGIKTEKLWLPNVLYSDHLPLVYDFTLEGQAL